MNRSLFYGPRTSRKKKSNSLLLAFTFAWFYIITIKKMINDFSKKY